MAMKQLALDIGLCSGPTLQNFCHGPNQSALKHLALWVGEKTTAATGSPVPTYLWGPSGSGKTHLLKAVREALREQGAVVGWLDGTQAEPEPYRDDWAAILLDDVHLYSPVQQHAAFTWFVNAQGHQRWVLGSGDAPPASLQVLSEPERRSVLRQAADARGVFLSDEVMDFMLTRFSRDLGSLMELLDAIDGYALQSKKSITVPLIKSMMENG